MTDKYSVLISVYKNEIPEYLNQCLQSMVNQEAKPDEIVIVKDGPLTLELDKIISNYNETYKDLFKVIELEKNVGLGLALDIGLKICRNNLVARMDSDDISLPKRCLLQLEKFNQYGNLSIIGTNIDEFYNDPKNIVSSRVVPSEYEEIVKFMKRRSPFNHPTVMYKKDDVLKCGGYGNLRRKQDLDLFSRMINNHCFALNINKSLLLFRSNEDNFKRRKSWDYCSNYIAVQYRILRRGHCSFFDFLFVLLGQLFMFASPMFLLKFVSKKYLRR